MIASALRRTTADGVITAGEPSGGPLATLADRAGRDGRAMPGPERAGRVMTEVTHYKFEQGRPAGTTGASLLRLSEPAWAHEGGCPFLDCGAVAELGLRGALRAAGARRPGVVSQRLPVSIRPSASAMSFDAGNCSAAARRRMFV